MATNFLLARDVNTLLVHHGNPDDEYYAGQGGSEIPLVPDNINRALIGLTRPMGLWSTHVVDWPNVSSFYDEAHRYNGCWTQPMEGAGYHGFAARPQGAYFMRSVIFSDEVTHFGYIGSVVGGFENGSCSFDAANNGNIDYEPPYGHGVMGWPRPNSLVQAQYRDSVNLPSDGGSRINLTGSAWTRSNRLHPVYYTAHIVSGGTIVSGATTFLVEQRPSTQMITGNGNVSPDTWPTDTIPTLFPTVTAEHYGMLLARLWNHSTHIYGGVSSLDPAINTTYPPLRASDPRNRNSACFQLNAEYYGFVVDSWLTIYTNKTSFLPVQLTDFATSWPSSLHPRIAGVASDPVSLNIWALAEGGELTLLDMSVEGGLKVPLTSGASALTDPTTERFGAMVKVGNYLYALVGSYSERFATPPSTQMVGIIRYSITSGLWDARHDCLLPARHGSRSLREMVALEDGRFAALVENIGAAVPVPTNLTTYSTDLPSTYGIPANLQTSIIKLDARDFENPAVARFKLQYQIREAHAIGAIIKSVPAGSPIGTAFAATKVITKAGATAWDNDSTFSPQTTDWIALVMDPAYDYYVFFYAGIPNASGVCYDGSSGPRYSIGYSPLSGTMSHSRSAFFVGDQRSLTTVPDLTTGWQSGAFHAIVCGIINDSGTDTFTNPVNSGLSEGRCAWQLLIHDYAGNTWNTSALTNSGVLSGEKTSMHTEMVNPAPGKLLIQASKGKDRLFLFDYSGTLNDTKFLDVSWGTGTCLLGSAWTFSTDLTIIKNLLDSSVMFWLPGAHLGWAHPSFAWDGSEKVQDFIDNAWNGGSTTSIDKDHLFAAQGMQDYSTIMAFADTQITITTPGGDASWFDTENVSECVYYLPRYFKWVGGAWAIAKNWADAEANPCTVPATPDTPVDGPHGLKFLFGPSPSTTFVTGEFHTINVAYGLVKFARRGRYTFTMFAGRTFQMSETRTMANLNAVIPVVHHPNMYQVPVTATGPDGITISGGHVTWPVEMDPDPMVAIYDYTLARPGKSIIPTMTGYSGGGMVVSASNEYDTGTWAAWHAFSKVSVHPLSVRAAWMSAAANPWLKVDCGVQKTVLSYSLSIRHDPGWFTPPTTGWSVQGSNDNTTWDTLHTVAGQDWGDNAPGSGYLNAVPYLANLTTSGAYRYYRVVLAHPSGYASISSVELYDQPLATSVNFSDLVMFNTVGVDYGLTFEVNKGSGFTTIVPKFRNHMGELYVFDRQEGVQQLRITSRYGKYLNATTRVFPVPSLWDYGTTPVMNAARLGVTGAAESTPARGSFDSQCIGVNTDAFAVSVDGVSPQQYSPLWSDDSAVAYRGWHWNGPWATLQSATGKFCVHPYFGFVRFSPDITGSNVQVTYAWGRRV